MSKRKKIYILVSAILVSGIFFSGCRSYVSLELPACTMESDLPGPYDLDFEEAGRNPFLIVSSQERRNRDPNNEMMETGAIYRIGTPVSGDSRVVRYTIQGRDEYPLHPYGIAVFGTQKERYLYMINVPVQGTWVVEIYKMRNEALTYVARLRSPLLKNPTDLVVAGPDEFYIINHQESQWSWLFGSLAYRNLPVVLRYNRGTWSVAVESIAGARGIALNQKRTLLAVSSEIEKKIYIYERDSTGQLKGPVRVVETPGVPELMSGTEGDLFVVAMNLDHSGIQKNRKTPGRKHPAEIYNLNGASGEMVRIYGNDGSRIRSISSVLKLNGRIYAGQFYDSGFLQCGSGQTNSGR